ncbi:MAG: hypothetical protein PHG35_03525 [Dehalococcoidales bacterium]|nr:hypothetical protein [Dehalococcoidales bacterium]
MEKLTKKSTSKKEKQECTVISQRAFLSAFSQSGHLGNSAKKASIERTTVYLWRNDANFDLLFDAARKQAVTVLEDEAHRRAYTGVDEPVYYKGQVCGVVRKYSDTLLIVLLKANDPEKYRERAEITGANGGPVAVIKEVEVRLSTTQT